MTLLIRYGSENGVGRRDDPSWTNLLDGGGLGALAPREAEGLSAVFACVDVIASALASLPPRLESGESDLLQRPNKWQTWPEFIEWYMGQVLLLGNAVAVLEADGLQPVPWSHASMEARRDGSLQYRVHYGPIPAEKRAVVPAVRTAHLRDRTDDGYTGVSRLRRCSFAVALSKDVEAAAAALWGRGGFPSGALVSSGRLRPEQREQLEAQVQDEILGPGNRAKVLLLDSALSWEGIDTDPDKLQSLETRQHQVVEVARVFGVPPPIIQDYTHNTFTNSQEASRWFAMFTLASWARKLEAVLSPLLPGRLELDLQHFTRADVSERWAGYAVALDHGVLTPEEVKAMEGW